MTVWRWATSGVPALSAFLPAVTKSVVSWQQYKANVTGQPGTQAIAAPNNDIPQDRLSVSSDHRSSDAPTFWFPQLWYEHTLPGLPFPAGANAGGVRIWSDNQIPVPSIEPQRGTYRYGGGTVVQPYMNTHRRAQTGRRTQARHG